MKTNMLKEISKVNERNKIDKKQLKGINGSIDYWTYWLRCVKRDNIENATVEGN